jgi:hypothetical protein
MKLILVNQRYGHTRTIVIRGWMKGFLSLCLLGAPVALGYLGYELALADAGGSSLVSQKSPVAADEFISGKHAEQQAQQLPGSAQTSGFELDDAPTIGAEPEHLNDSRAFVPSHSSPIFIAHGGPSAYISQSHRAPFQHGRVIDPASYLHQTLY